jgi:hypothetical protein
VLRDATLEETLADLERVSESYSPGERRLPARIGTAIERSVLDEALSVLQNEGFTTVRNGQFRTGPFPWLRRIFPGRRGPDSINVRTTGNRPEIVVGDSTARARAQHIADKIADARSLRDSPHLPAELRNARIVLREWYWEDGAQVLNEIVIRP